MAPDLPINELMKPLPNGLPSVSSYNEFLKVTGEKDSGDMFVVWIQAAYILMQPTAGRC